MFTSILLFRVFIVILPLEELGNGVMPLKEQGDSVILVTFFHTLRTFATGEEAV